MRLEVGGAEVDGALVDGMIDHALGEHRAQDALGHLVQSRLRHLACLDRLEQQVGEERLLVERMAGLLVRPAARGLHRAV